MLGDRILVPRPASEPPGERPPSQPREHCATSKRFPFMRSAQLNKKDGMVNHLHAARDHK